jgi:hypothetical protein
VALEKIRKYKEGEDAIRRAVALEPNNVLYRINWGDLLLHLKQYNAAENQYIKASKLNKEHSLAYLGLANVYVQLGDEMGERVLYEDALEQLNKIVRIGIPEKDADRFKYYFLRGLANVKLGNWNEAEEDFKECGEDPKAKRNIRRIRNKREKERRPSGTTSIGGGIVLIGGLVVAIISIILLVLSSIQYFYSFKNIKQVDANLFKVLAPTFLTFSVGGFLLRYLQKIAINVPGGIGLEIETRERPESRLSEIIIFEPHLLEPLRSFEPVYIPESRDGK